MRWHRLLRRARGRSLTVGITVSFPELSNEPQIDYIGALDTGSPITTVPGRCIRLSGGLPPLEGEPIDILLRCPRRPRRPAEIYERICLPASGVQELGIPEVGFSARPTFWARIRLPGADLYRKVMFLDVDHCIIGRDVLLHQDGLSLDRWGYAFGIPWSRKARRLLKGHALNP